MDATTYLELSGRTMAQTFFGEKVSPYFMAIKIADRLNLNRAIDGIKKALFYGKVKDGVPENFSDAEHPYQVQADELHAILGVDTESAELIELLVEGKLTRQKVVDEGGDLLWYLAALFRKYGVTFEEAMASNIDKLMARYPEGFSTDRAVNRNEVLESAVFQ